MNLEASVKLRLPGWRQRGPQKVEPKLPLAPPSRLPRITRLMALTIKFQEMVDRGEVRDYADLARLGYVTRARLTQIMNLVLLAPEIQERLLDGLPADRAYRESELRRVVRRELWEDQLALLGPTPNSRS